MPNITPPPTVRRFGSGRGSQIHPTTEIPPLGVQDVPAVMEAPPAHLGDNPQALPTDLGPGEAAAQGTLAGQELGEVPENLADGPNPGGNGSSDAPDLEDNLAGDGTSDPASTPQKGPRLNAAALGSFLSSLDGGAAPALKTFSISMQIDSKTYQFLAGKAGYRGLPELMRQVLIEVANSPLITPAHLKNAVREVAQARRPEKRGGVGPAPKTSIPVDGPTNRTVEVLARRAGIAPKGVVEAVAFIYAGLAKAAEASTAEPHVG